MRNFKKSFMALATVCFFISSMLLGFANVKVNAEELKNVTVRVEGLSSTIIQGNSKGNTAWDAVKQLLDIKKISYKTVNSKFGIYVEEINGLKAGKYNQYDGWMYYIKEGNKIIEPATGIADYKLKNNDSIVVYYGAFGVTDICNKIKFEPKVLKANQTFKMQFLYNHFDYNTNKDVQKAISDVKVLIDSKEYSTNKDGFIEVQGLSKGEHNFKISGYQNDNVPKVVMEEGTFKIDNTNLNKVNFINTKDISRNANKDNSKENNNKTIANKKEEKKLSYDVSKDYKETLDYLKSDDTTPWVSFSLYKAGVKFDSTFLTQLDDEIENQPIDKTRPSHLETNSIGLASLGYSPYDYKGNNLIKELYSRDLNKFFTNEVIFALLTHRALNVDDTYNITKKDLVNKILSSKLTNDKDGKKIFGWAWAGKTIDPDMTAAAINALAPYYRDEKLEGVDNNKVKEAVNQTVETLSLLQKEDGNIVGMFGPSSETNSFTIMALTSVGINPAGDKFTKAKGNLVSALLDYKGDNGQFNHNNQVKNNYMATDQAFRALMCLKNFNGKNHVDYYTSNINAKDLKIVNSDGSIKEVVNKPKDKEENQKDIVAQNDENNKKDSSVNENSNIENKDDNLNSNQLKEDKNKKNNNKDNQKDLVSENTQSDNNDSLLNQNNKIENKNTKLDNNEPQEDNISDNNQNEKDSTINEINDLDDNDNKINDELKEEEMPVTGAPIGSTGAQNIAITIISLGILILYKNRKGE